MASGFHSSNTHEQIRAIRMKQKFDLLGLGTVAVDELIFVESFPLPDAKTRVLQAERRCGGLTAAPLITAARLGAKCAYAGMLGHDELSRFAAAELRREKVNLKFLFRHPEARPVHSFIVIDQQRNTRNVFSHRTGLNGPAPDWPDETIIRSTRVLLIDHYGLDGMIRAARLARKHGIPVVADFERVSGPEFPELLDLADHLILSESFALKLTGRRKIEHALAALWTKTRSVVVITAGEKGCWFASAAGRSEIKHYPALRVDVVDTNGCGDVFHGAYAAGLAKGKDLEARIALATITAAAKAQRIGL